MVFLFLIGARVSLNSQYLRNNFLQTRYIQQPPIRGFAFGVSYSRHKEANKTDSLLLQSLAITEPRVSS